MHPKLNIATQRGSTVATVETVYFSKGKASIILNVDSVFARVIVGSFTVAIQSKGDSLRLRIETVAKVLGLVGLSSKSFVFVPAQSEPSRADSCHRVWNYYRQSEGIPV